MGACETLKLSFGLRAAALVAKATAALAGCKSKPAQIILKSLSSILFFRLLGLPPRKQEAAWGTGHEGKALVRAGPLSLQKSRLIR
jgi:hypothetical protein